jgi:superfamily II DNA or RNA helicase
LFTGTLLPYQIEAVDAMVSRKKMLVAYDLGLGKTVLTIAAIERLKESGDITLARYSGLFILSLSISGQSR